MQAGDRWEGHRSRSARRALLRACVLSVCALALPAAPAHPQILFGKNKVQYEAREWRVLRTAHVEVFFYPEEERLAREVAALAESTCVEYDSTFRMRPDRRIPVLLYSSHQAFQQTNAAHGFISESTGGLTELIKGRVLIPHVGSRRRLVWVTRHELVHAYMLEKLRRTLSEHGKYRQSLPPLWFIEGLAELLSTSWDSQAEGLLQDAVVAESAYPVTESWPITGTVLMYKEGQSFLLYLTERFGRDRVMDLLDNWWKAETFDKVFAQTFGCDLRAVDAEWFEELKRRYYPRVAERVWAEELARPLTGGEAYALAPSGLDARSDSSFRFVYLAAEEGSSSLMLATVEGGEVRRERLLRGGFSASFESFHLFRSRVGASPGGRLAVVAQRGGRDVLHIYDVSARRVVATWAPPGLVALAGPAWMPEDSALVVTGQRVDGQVDLYRVRVGDGATTALTDDREEEHEVSVHPEGRRVVFTSDRDGGAAGRHHLYELDLDTGAVRHLTGGPGSERDPAWSPDGRTLVFRSDRAGTDDLYLWRDGHVLRLTHLLGPPLAPSWTADGRSVLFCGQSKLTFQIYRLPVETAGEGWVAEEPGRGLEPAPTPHRAREAAEPYRRRLGLDLAQHGVALDPTLGAVGAGQVAISDLLGDESLYIFLSNDSESYGSFLDGMEVGLTYYNRRHRLNCGVGLFRLTTIYDPDFDALRRERRIGGMLLASYPFSKFTRLEGSFVLRHAQDHYLRAGRFADLWLASNFLSFVRDNVRWTRMGPTGGMRWNLSAGFTRDLTAGSGDFFTLITDYRRYLEPVPRLVSATRLLVEHSFGDDAQRFYLGGRQNLRGFPRRYVNGKTVVLVQQEFRFPLLRGLTFGFPDDWVFPTVSGALFADVGTAGDAGRRFERRASFGGGVFIGGGYFPMLRWDFIRRHDFVRAEKDWVTVFTLGFHY